MWSSRWKMGSPTREAYGRALARIGQQNPNIVALDADLAKSTMSKMFGDVCPDRFFYVGVCEQNLMTVAAGLALAGKIPFASTFAVFATSRAFDQLRVSITQSRANVKVVASHGGLMLGEDGATHQALEDVGLVCMLPGWTVIVPADEIETEQAVEAAAGAGGPFYIRTGRPKVPIVHTPDYRFEIGRAARLREGSDITIVAMGVMVAIALQAADVLATEGIECRVLNMATVKPIDKEAVIAAAVETGAIVTAEEHQRHGGLGSIVASILAEARPTPMRLVGINDRWGRSGKPEPLLELYGLGPEHVAAAVRDVLRQKATVARAFTAAAASTTS